MSTWQADPERGKRQGQFGIRYCVPGHQFERGASPGSAPRCFSGWILKACGTAAHARHCALNVKSAPLRFLAETRCPRALLRAWRFLYRSACCGGTGHRHAWPLGSCAARTRGGAGDGRHAQHHEASARFRGGRHLQAAAYGQSLRIGDVTVRLVPAGHILGSAQVVIDYKGQRAVISGDYKRYPDPTCAI
jgi:hypothetical protein